ncbi:hypothetical protein DRQ53_00155 [bacterium]|nr:MAG: hypothetical protein DRQ53_00155 [bacterium]
MSAKSRIRGLIIPTLALLATLLALPGCEEDSKPKITKFTATPQCDVVKTVTEVIFDPSDSSIVAIDTLGTWLDVSFFARATSGNELADPTGANSPLEWSWNFGDGKTASNTVGPIHQYDVAGEYEVTLTVKDDDGDTDSASLTLLVGAAYTDLDILHIDIEPASMLTFKAIPGSTATDESQIWGGQLELNEMEVVFDGNLVSSCSISGLFEQYLWEWTLMPAGLPPVELVDVDPAKVDYTPHVREFAIDLSVTESVTGINRITSSSSLNPLGAKVSFTEDLWTAPNTTARLDLTGYLLNGVKELTMELEWADSAATFSALTFDPAIEAGFTASSDLIAPNRLAITLTSATGYADQAVTSKIADLDLNMQAVKPGLYPVRIREPFALRDGDPAEGGLFTAVNGAVLLDSDCNENGIADSFEVEVQPELFDCNGNGIHDTCDILNGDSQDDNDDGIPDECQQ